MTTGNGYTWTVTALGTAYQGGTSIGYFAKLSTALDPLCISGTRYYQLGYVYGVYASGCSATTTPPNFRNAAITMECNVTGPVAMTYVTESPACNYQVRTVDGWGYATPHLNRLQPRLA